MDHLVYYRSVNNYTCLRGRFPETQNEERENIRQKALVEKRRKVKLFSETIDSIIERYNSVVETINAPSDFKFLDGTYTNIKTFSYYYIFIYHSKRLFYFQSSKPIQYLRN